MIDESRLVAVLKENECLVQDSDRAFLTRMVDGGLGRYRKRIAQYGFVGRTHVLDAGAGFGQWSLALADENIRVTSLEVDSSRVSFIRAVSEALHLDNLTVQEGSIAEIPYSDATFDAVFCYGVLVQTPWREVLEEFSRVIAKDGIIYANANGIGWFRYLWETEHNQCAHYEPRERCAMAFMNTYRYDRGLSVDFPSPVMVVPEQFAAHLQSCGFTNIELGSEGALIHQAFAQEVCPSFFEGEYRGDPCIFEVLARCG